MTGRRGSTIFEINYFYLDISLHTVVIAGTWCFRPLLMELFFAVHKKGPSTSPVSHLVF